MASGFSLEEMKTIAAEVGLDPLLVERAARLTPVDASESRFDRILGGPVKYRFGGHFETKLTDETAAHLLAVVRAAAEQQGEGEASASGVSWHSVGEGTQLLLSAHAEGEGTRVTIVADRRSSLAIHATFSAMGALAVGIAILVGGEVAEVQSLSLGLAMIGGGAASVFALGRAVWRSTARGVRERALALMETVGRSLEDSGLEPTPDEGAAGQAQ
jgi:hypothetical protein